MKPTNELRWRKVAHWENSHTEVDGQQLVLQQKWLQTEHYERPSFLDPDAPMTYESPVWLDVPVEEE